jgi:DnaD/phage-associated family protein
MSKTILAQVDGFTPVIDGVIAELGLISAAVFGKAWRYCQMSDGVCKASQDRIASELGISRATVNDRFSELTRAGYLEDMTPDLLGMPHQYRDTGKANLSISFTATSKTDLHPPVKKIDTKKVFKKEIKENDDVLAIISRAYEQEIAQITPMIADELREASTAYPLQWTLDAIKESATQNKRGWKYVLAILKRWGAQGNQEAMKRPTYTPAAKEPKGFDAIRQWASKQEDLGNVI